MIPIFWSKLQINLWNTYCLEKPIVSGDKNILRQQSESVPLFHSWQEIKSINLDQQFLSHKEIKKITNPCEKKRKYFEILWTVTEVPRFLTESLQTKV